MRYNIFMPVVGFNHYSEHNSIKIIQLYGIERDIDYNGKKCKTIKKRLISTDRIPYIDDNNGDAFLISWRVLYFSLDKPHYNNYRLGNKGGQHNRFSKEEDEIIKKYYSEFGAQYCAQLMNKKSSSISGRAHVLKIRKKRISKYKNAPNRINNNNEYQSFILKKRKETNEGKKYITIRDFIRSAKKRCKNKNLSFDLSKEYLESIFPEYCPVLGIKLELCQRENLWNCPSLDRINNNLGYIKSNVRIISYKANTLKNDATVEEINNLINYFKGKYTSSFLFLNQNEENIIYNRYKSAYSRSKKNKLEFDLIPEYLYKIVPEKCPITNKLINFNSKFDCPSLDRFDNNKGYIIDNIKIISRKGNTIKNCGKLEDFEKIYKYMINNYFE